MLSNILGIFKKDIKLLISSFIILLLSSFLLTQIVLNFGNVIAQSGTDVLDSNSFSFLMSVISPVGSVILMLTTMILNMNQSILISSRKKRLDALRTLGYTTFKIKKLLFAELLILALIAMCISMPVAMATNQTLVNYFRRIGALESPLVIKNYWYLYLISAGFVLFTLIVALVFSTTYLKKWNSNKKSKKSSAAVYVFGFTSLLGGIAILSIPNLMKGGLGVGMIIIATPMILHGLIAFHKPIFSFVLKLFNKLFRRGSIGWLSIKSATYSIVKLSGVIVLTFISVAFGLIGIESAGILKAAKMHNTNIFLQTSVNDLYEPIDDKTLDEMVKDITDFDNELLLSGEKLLKDEDDKEVGVSAIVGNIELLSFDDFEFDASLWTKEDSIITSDSDYQIGDTMKLNVDGTLKTFTVAGVFEKWMKYNGFPDSYTMYDNISSELEDTLPYLIVVDSQHGFNNSEYQVVDMNVLMHSANDVGDSVMLVFTIVIIIFSIITIINIIYILHLNQKHEKKQLRNLGMLKSQIKKINILAVSIVSTLATFISVSLVIGINILYSSANNYHITLVFNDLIFWLVVSMSMLLPPATAFVFDFFTKK